MNKSKFSKYIIDFDFKTLFNELGWDNFDNKLSIAIDEEAFELNGIVEKKGFVILHCPPDTFGKIQSSKSRKQIENKTAKSYFEHLIIYSDKQQSQQIWQLAIKEEHKPKQVREVSWHVHQDTDVLFQRLKNLLFTLDEEEDITLVDVKQKISESFSKNTEKVTKKFYTDFKKQHTAFLEFITGIDDAIADKDNTNKQWYASIMLNRLMFCYFIQKKGFLNQNFNYLQDKLNECTEKAGKDKFYSFYRSFLLELFHDGLGRPKSKRKRKAIIEMGKIPYLNGGLFDVHLLEKQFDKIQISDTAFKRIFDFFDQWNWHLDNRIDATGKDINPDVIGYIFEKYINDRADMGAYYTKEDITEYIGKNTIIPFLFEETQRNYKAAFKPDQELWQTLKYSNDTYIYDAVKKGIPKGVDLFEDLPEDIKAGFLPKLEKEIVSDKTETHLWEIRKPWNQKAPEDIALPTEIYRELIERRKRYAEIKSKIENGKIHHINDFITYNLDIRQFAQDFLETTEDPAFIRHFYKVIREITVLDPTCGSGAFLFAALNILEPLYEACIMRMEQFVAEQPGKYKFFEGILKEVKSDQHPSLIYFIYKSIILNNLYGVDIMKEAVEIAKLRLFLKLVATVDVDPNEENFGLEPLPDIDFNIRAGNTLVGFATETELFKTIQKKEGLFAGEKLEQFKEECELVNKAFQRFKDTQLITDVGSDEFKIAKNELQNRLNNLNEALNRYLANNYGIDADMNLENYKLWLASHQPFHWFAEFYNIIAENKGFHLIVGNPPYVEYKNVINSYQVNNLLTQKCGNLFAYVIERCQTLVSASGYNGFIIPLSGFSTDRMKPLIKILKTNSENLSIAHFSWRPGRLFEGVNLQLSIFLQKKGNINKKVESSNYILWDSIARDVLFFKLTFSTVTDETLKGAIPKTGFQLSKSVLKKIRSTTCKLATYIPKNSTNYIYYRRGGLYWKVFVDFKTGSSEEKILNLLPAINKYSIVALLSSNLWFWYYWLTSDCRHLGNRDIYSFPFDPLKMNQKLFNELVLLGKRYVHDLIGNAKDTIRVYKGVKSVNVLSFNVNQSKNLIDEVDRLLAQHFSLTEEELDFIINYDVKYRMGKVLFGENKDNGVTE